MFDCKPRAGRERLCCDDRQVPPDEQCATSHASRRPPSVSDRSLRCPSAATHECWHTARSCCLPMYPGIFHCFAIACHALDVASTRTKGHGTCLRPRDTMPLKRVSMHVPDLLEAWKQNSLVVPALCTAMCSLPQPALDTAAASTPTRARYPHARPSRPIGPGGDKLYACA